MAKLAIKDLAHEGACEGQLILFEETFGDSVDVTDELCVRYADTFDFEWASRALLRCELKDEYRAYVKAAARRKSATYNQADRDCSRGKVSRHYYYLTTERARREMQVTVARLFCRYFNQQGGAFHG